MKKDGRCGAVLEKLGMTQFFAEDGKMLPVTLLKLYKNIVVSLKNEKKHGYNAVVIGYNRSKSNKVSKSVKGIISAAGLSDISEFKEFRVAKDCLQEVGQEVLIDHFSVGQYVDAQSFSIGKGFAGVMKRHNFAGLEASHGVSVSHRSHGSTGQREFPGKVFKGKKMAGHMGNRKKTLQNMRIIDIDRDLKVIAVLGAVPGSKGSRVILSDAVKKALPVASGLS